MSDISDIEMLDYTLPLADHLLSIEIGDVAFLDASTPVGNIDVDAADQEFIARVRADWDMYENADNFRKSLVDYIIRKSSVLVCHKVSTWQSFLTENPRQSKNLTCAQLRDFFIHSILPQIYVLGMSEAQRNEFDILSLNECFERIPNGYKLKAAVEYMPLKYDVDYALLNVGDINKENEAVSKEAAASEPPERFVLETQKSDPMASHFFIVTGAGAAPQKARPKSQPQMSAENFSLLSAVVSTEYELFHSAGVEREEMLARLRNSRSLFQRTGRRLITLDAKQLKQKVKLMTHIKNSVSALTQKRF